MALSSWSGWAYRGYSSVAPRRDASDACREAAEALKYAGPAYPTDAAISACSPTGANGWVDSVARCAEAAEGADALDIRRDALRLTQRYQSCIDAYTALYEMRVVVTSTSDDRLIQDPGPADAIDAESDRLFRVAYAYRVAELRVAQLRLAQLRSSFYGGNSDYEQSVFYGVGNAQREAESAVARLTMDVSFADLCAFGSDEQEKADHYEMSNAAARRVSARANGGDIAEADLQVRAAREQRSASVLNSTQAKLKAEFAQHIQVRAELAMSYQRIQERARGASKAVQQSVSDFLISEARSWE